MGIKLLLGVIVIAAIFNGVLSYEKYFVPDESEYREEGEHIDILLKKRNLRIERVCMKYNDLHRPENYNVSMLMDWNKKWELPHTGLVDRFDIYTTPKMVMCSPRNVAHKALRSFSKEAVTSFPIPTPSKTKKETKQAPEMKKKVPKAMRALKNEVRSAYKETKDNKKVQSVKEAKQKYAGFSKMLLVMHPFIRLAKSYQQLFNSFDKNVDKESLATQSKIADYIQKINQKSDQETSSVEGFAKIPSFAEFVKFIINSSGSNNVLDSSEDRKEVLNLRKQWLPTHYDCEVCHPDLLPNFVYKVDDDNFEDEFMEFLEDFGLEEVKEGEAAEELIQSVNVKDKNKLMKYFADLDKTTMDDLVSFYRIDLEMFGYLDLRKFL